MFCPHCGTQANTGAPRFCHECGREIGAPAQSDHSARNDPQLPSGPSTGTSSGAPPSQRPFFTTTNVIVKDHTMKTLLIVGGLLLLLPLAIPLFFGTLLAGLVAGAVLVGLAFKAAPLIAIAIAVYWFLNRQRRMPHSRQ